MPPFRTRQAQERRPPVARFAVAAKAASTTFETLSARCNYPLSALPWEHAMSLQGTALVTGASGGIGAAYAERLARRGYDLTLVGRNRSRLNTLSARISDETGRDVQVLAADLSDRNALASVESFLKNDASLRMLVNSAGVGATAPLLRSDVDKMDEMIALNVSVLVRLTYAAALGLVARGKGAIINIASSVAIGPETLNGVYGGTKAFVLAFSRSLRHELEAKGVRVQAVLPGATLSEFWHVAGMPAHNLPRELVMPVGEMVDAALTGLDLGEFATFPSLPDIADWDAFEAARQKLLPNLSRTHAAARYREQPKTQQQTSSLGGNSGKRLQ
jgi:short-subunit dehydrogenase